MSRRAIWKAVLRVGAARVPVKLYAAVEDRSVHFRLLHAKDRAPVRQAMVHPESGEVVSHERTRRGYLTEEGELVVFEQHELEAIRPESARDIRVLHSLPAAAIDPRWYDRPYYLGPDDSGEADASDGAQVAYAALRQALADDAHVALARWAMRDKEYVGVLRLHEGHPMLITLRHEGEVLDLDALDPDLLAFGDADALGAAEVAMAEQLLDLLAGPFDPDAYRDDYRARVLDLIEAKRKGEAFALPPAPERRRPGPLAQALEASLRDARRHA